MGRPQGGLCQLELPEGAGEGEGQWARPGLGGSGQVGSDMHCPFFHPFLRSFKLLILSVRQLCARCIIPGTQQ